MQNYLKIIKHTDMYDYNQSLGFKNEVVIVIHN